MTARKKLMIARFPYGNAENPDVADWFARTLWTAKNHPALEPEVLSIRLDDTPITMTRNLAVRMAQQEKVDFLLMIDSDMKPDINPLAPPFFDTALEEALKAPAPGTIIAAPYCGPPPCCNVFVFRWVRWMNDAQNVDWRLDQFSREEAELCRGFWSKDIAALPTGLILFDMRIFGLLPKPYFFYEWKDDSQSEKASTEDVAFTRDASLAGVPLVVAWDSWAGHHKRYTVGKPRSIRIEDIRESFRDAIRRNLSRSELHREVYVKDGKVLQYGEGFAQDTEENADAGHELTSGTAESSVA